MSRIEAVTCRRVSVPLHTPFVTALRRTETMDTVVVQVRDSDGVLGWGEAPQVWQVTGESLAGAQDCLETMLAPRILGRDSDDLVPLLQDIASAVARNNGAKSALDVALHDLTARRRAVSMPVLLGANRHEVPTDVTVSAGGPDALAATAAARVGEGFTTLKLKVGTDAHTDVARVRAVREAVGPEVAIRLDANQGWTPRQAVTVIAALVDADLGVEFVEQPVAAADLAGLAWVTARSELPVMADESCYDLRDLVRIIAEHAADLVNIKLAKCGGLAPARALLDLARAHQVGAIVGSMMETHIGVGAAASLVAAYGTPATGTTLVSDLDAPWWAVGSPFTGGLRYARADSGVVVVLPDGPGMGIEGLRPPGGSAQTDVS